MPKYKVSFTFCAPEDRTVEVEADNEDDALDLAWAELGNGEADLVNYDEVEEVTEDLVTESGVYEVGEVA
jgi:hypothetical protein